MYLNIVLRRTTTSHSIICMFLYMIFCFIFLWDIEKENHSVHTTNYVFPLDWNKIISVPNKMHLHPLYTLNGNNNNINHCKRTQFSWKSKKLITMLYRLNVFITILRYNILRCCSKIRRQLKRNSTNIILYIYTITYYNIIYYIIFI